MNNQTSKQTQIFESYSIPKAVMTLAVPTVLSQIVSIIYNFSDTWFVGRTENPNAVAALSICMPIYIIMMGIANLFGIGGSSVISRSLGARKSERARHAFALSLWGGVASALLYAVVIAVFRKPIIPLIGGDDNSFAYAYDYMFWTMIIGAVPTIVNTVLSHLVRSVGAAKQAGIGISLGAGLNIVLDPLFMFVLLPKGHEVTGAAIATLISNIVAALYFIVLIKRRGDKVFTLNPKEISLSDGIPFDVLMTGFPAALSTCLAMVSNIFANSLISDYGTSAVAGMGVAKRVNTLAFNINMGLTQGVLPLIGYNFAAKNFKRMRGTIYFAGSITLVFSLLCTTFFRFFSTGLISFFIDEAETVYYGARFLPVIAFAVPLCALTYSMNTVFQAAGKKLNSFILSILRKGLLDIPTMFLFRSFAGEMGVVWATPFAEAISVVIAFFLFVIFMRKIKGMEKEG